MRWVGAAALAPIAGALLLGVRALALAGWATAACFTGRPPGTALKKSPIVFGGSL